MSSVWRLTPSHPYGGMIAVRVSVGAEAASLVSVGVLDLRRGQYADLVARLGVAQAFDAQTGQARTITVTEPAPPTGECECCTSHAATGSAT